jgi:tetratricopeptide (TPR) repeat protein
LNISSGGSILKTFTVSAFVACSLGACSTISGAHTSVGEQKDAGGITPDNAQTIVAQVTTGSSVTDSSGGLADTQRWHSRQLSIAAEADQVFKILSAEIAGRRGRIDIAAENYFDVAQTANDPRVAERAVKLALYSRDIERADSASTLWVELDPQSVEAWQHRAQISLQQKKVDDTTDALARVISLSSDAPAQVIPGVVNSILSQSDADTGVLVLTQLADRYPESADAQYGIGRFAMSRGERETALQAFEKALALDPENVDALLSRARLEVDSGAGDAALEKINDFVEANPQNISAQLGYARLLVETGDYEDATERFDIISAEFPEDADSLFTIGLLALEIKRIKHAEQYLLQVVDLDMHQDSANYYLARISDSRKDYREAVERYQRVQNGDNYFDAQIRAAELLGLVGEVDQGRELIAELRSYTQERSLKIELLNAESRLLNSSDRHEDAYQVLTEGLMEFADDTSLLYARALVAERLDKREEFERDLLKVISAQPDNGYALNALGYFLVDRNERLDEAEKYLERAIELLPDDPAIIDSVGWLYYRQNKYAESIDMLRRAYSLFPDAEIAAHLGEVLWVSGDQEAATEVWEEALRETPDDDLLNQVMKKYQR